MSVRTIRAGQRGTVRHLSPIVAPTSTGLPLIAVIPPSIAPVDPILPTYTLQGSPGIWIGDGTITFAYQWQRCDAAGDNAVPIPGATLSQYVVTDTDVGSTIRLSVTATDNAHTVTVTTAQTVTVTGAASGASIELSARILTGSTTIDYPCAVYCNGRLWLGTFGEPSNGPLQVDVIDADDTLHTNLLQNLGSHDDHSSPTILVVTGRVPQAFWCPHNQGFSMYQYRGSTAAENGSQSLTRVPGSINWSAVSVSVTYEQIHTVGDVIHLWTRIRGSGATNNSRYTGYTRSSDWGLTWDVPPRRVFDMGFASSYDYCVMRLAPDNRTIRRSGMDDPAQVTRNQVRYFEIDTITGDIVGPPGGPILGNLYSGSNLPIVVTAGGASLVRQAPSGTRVSVRDTGRNARPEVLWVEYTGATYAEVQASATYWYGIYTAGAWSCHPICKAGGQFGQDIAGDYFGGATFTNLAEGQVLLCRRSDAGEWSVERWSSTDAGVTWQQVSVIQRSSTHALVRPRQVEVSGKYKAVYCKVLSYGTGNSPPIANGDLTGYINWSGSSVIVHSL